MNEPLNSIHTNAVKQSLARNVLVDTAARFGYLATRFFIPPFVLGHIGMDAYGIWASCFILVSYLGVSTLGISAVYVKFIAEYHSRKEYARINSLVSTGLISTGPICAMLFTGVWFLYPHIASWIKVPVQLAVDAREVVLIVVGVFLSSITLHVFRNALSAVQQISTVQGVWVVSYLTETSLIYILLSQGRGLRGLAEAFLIRNIIEIIACAVLAFRHMPWLRISLSAMSREHFRLLVSFGGIVQLLSIMAIVLDSIERAIALPLIGVVAAGHLEIGTKLPTMAATFPSAIAAALLPAAAYLHGGIVGDEDRSSTLTKLYCRSARYMNLAAAYICAFICLMPTAILHVWLRESYESVPFVLCVFGFTTQVHMLTGPGTSVLRGAGHPTEEFWYCIPNILMLAITLPIAWVIVGGWTLQAITVGVCSSTILAAAFFVRRANRLMNLAPSAYWRKVLIPGLVPYLAAAVVSLPVNHLVSLSPRWQGLVYLISGGLAYSAITALLVYRFVFTEDERIWSCSIGRRYLSIPLSVLRAPGLTTESAG